MSNEKIKKEMQAFQAAIKRLSAGVSGASSLWSDVKFVELSSSVSEVANQSKNVVIAADKCCSSIERFEKIASEKY